ncbi:hypothetical protein WN944_006662 [Citrus x changshan-huyou]|uniref:Protein MAINTENANCE OF PSII UNDER HIGH LIGHT 1 n=1 Tax=Citrus x changshan-huyou TaxID=2935761 RepID=A0AAP0QU17_9ROSI
MACASQAMISANSYIFTSPKLLFNRKHKNQLYSRKRNVNLFAVRASSDDPDDCNDEECAPDKEVGKVSMEWLAGEKTKVAGTFPPRKREWTGYVEKDTAGQTNIYAVEPTVYVADSAISSGSAGSSAAGSENTIAITAGVAFLAIAAASSILLQVGKNPPQMQTIDYNGPSLSYYINKFKPPAFVQASVSSPAESSPSVQAETSAQEVPQIQIQSESNPEPSTNNIS